MRDIVVAPTRSPPVAALISGCRHCAGLAASLLLIIVSAAARNHWYLFSCLESFLISCGQILQVLLSVCSLLTDPNPADPLVGSIAKQLTEDKEAHERTAAEWTKRYAQG